jgi:hypothetical protein
MTLRYDPGARQLERQRPGAIRAFPTPGQTMPSESRTPAISEPLPIRPDFDASVPDVARIYCYWAVRTTSPPIGKRQAGYDRARPGQRRRLAPRPHRPTCHPPDPVLRRHRPQDQARQAPVTTALTSQHDHL